MTVEQYGSFLEAAIAINLLPQWKAVFDWVTKWRFSVPQDQPGDDAVVRIVRAGDKWQLRLWRLAKFAGVIMAIAAYLTLAFASAIDPVLFALIGFLTPTIMLVGLPALAHVFLVAARIQGVLQRIRKRKADRVEAMVQARIEAKIADGELQRTNRHRHAERSANDQLHESYLFGNSGAVAAPDGTYIGRIQRGRDGHWTVEPRLGLKRFLHGTLHPSRTKAFRALCRAHQRSTGEADDPLH